MKTKKFLLIVSGVAILGAAAWYFNHDGSESAGAKAGAHAGALTQQPPTIVNVVTALRQDVPVVLQASGTVVPLSTVDLHPQTTSTIRQVHIREGQFVKNGELMFSLDDRADRANIDKAQAQLMRDQAALADAERQYQRSLELSAQKFIAQSASDTLRSQVDAARALLNADLAAVQAAKVLASYDVIRAPAGGRVGAINVYPGSLVQLATSLTTITQLDPITVSFTLPESNLADLLAAQKLGSVMVQASLAEGAKPVVGALSFIDNTVDSSTGTIRVKARFDNRGAALWPGQYVNTRVTAQTLKGAVVVPQAAIISNTTGTFVYTAEADLSARQRPVVRLYSYGLNAAVSGLEGGEKVITEGKQNLRPDGKIRLAEVSTGPKGEGGHGAKKGAAK